MIPFPIPCADERPDPMQAFREAEPAGEYDVETLRRLGAAAREGGRLGRAAELLGRSLRIASLVGDPRQIGEVLRDRGDLRLRQGDALGAAADWRLARQRFVEGGATGDARSMSARLASLPGRGR